MARKTYADIRNRGSVASTHIRSIKERVIKEDETEHIIYKITPHFTNLNSTVRKFEHSLYELFSYKHPKYPWQRKNHTGGLLNSLKKDNLYISLKRNPSIWWVIDINGTKNKDIELGLSDTSSKEGNNISVISFYVTVPKEFKEAFRTKFFNHDQWRKATLEVVEKDDFIFPTLTNTDVYNLRYKRNSMFSLKHDYAQQSSPIRDILSISREIKEGERVCLFINTEPMSRTKWKSLVDYSWNVWNSGRVPSKAGMDLSMVGKDIMHLANLSLYEVKGVVDDILQGVGNAFFNEKNSTAYKSKNPSPSNSERAKIMVDGKLSEHTDRKKIKPVFKTNFLYTITSPDIITRDMLNRSVENSFLDLNGNNSLEGVKIKINTKGVLHDLSHWKIDNLSPCLMSTDELGKLHQLPTADVQREFKDNLDSNQRVETELSKELLDEDGILAGTSTYKGHTKSIHIQTKNPDITATARAVIGSPRMGKDHYVMNLIVEAKKKHNRGAVILDVIDERRENKGMSNVIRDHLNPEDIIDLNLMDTENPIYLGLEPIVELIKDPRIAADRVAEELTSFLLQDGDEDKLQTVDFLREASKLTNGDILGIKKVFTDEEYRKNLIKEKKNLFDTDIWEQYNVLGEGRQIGIYTPIMRRLGQIINSEFLKPIFCQKANNKLDLYKMIDEGKVIIFRLKTGVVSTRAMEIITYWIVLVTFLIKLAQGDERSKTEGTFLVLNEPNQYMTTGLSHFIERIFGEGPKYRLTPVVIFHHFKQFKKHSSFVDMMKSASLNWHIFRNTNEDVYKELFPYLSKTFETPQQAFEATKKHQFIGVWLDSDGSYYDPFIADALPMVMDRYNTKDNSHLTIEHAKMYGRPIEEVLKEIKMRMRITIKPKDSKTKSKGEKKGT